MRTTVFVFFVVLALALNANAQSHVGRAGLHGVLGMRVVIEPPPSNTKLTAEQLQTDVELRLRKAGIRVIDDDGQSPRAPFLYLNFFALKSDSASAYATNTTLEFHRIGTFVGVDKDMKRIEEEIFAIVWLRDAVGVCSNSAMPQLEMGIRQKVADLTDEFLNDYLAANPKP
jgi:hypothetical protein